MVRTDGKEFGTVEIRPDLPDTLRAPVEKGTEVGKLCYYDGEEKLGEIPVYAGESVEKAALWDYIICFFRKLFGK